jgi:hypothetical protein
VGINGKSTTSFLDLVQEFLIPIKDGVFDTNFILSAKGITKD